MEKINIYIFTYSYLFDILIIVVLQSERMEAMHMEKHEEAAFLGYFILLLLLVVTSMTSNIGIINLGYLIVVLCCSLKFILIVNRDKK